MRFFKLFLGFSRILWRLPWIGSESQGLSPLSAHSVFTISKFPDGILSVSVALSGALEACGLCCEV